MKNFNDPDKHNILKYFTNEVEEEFFFPILRTSRKSETDDLALRSGAHGCRSEGHTKLARLISVVFLYFIFSSELKQCVISLYIVIKI